METVLLNETAYCDQCGTVHQINDVISDTTAPKSDRTPEGTRVRRVRFECGNQTNVISRFVPRR